MKRLAFLFVLTLGIVSLSACTAKSEDANNPARANPDDVGAQSRGEERPGFDEQGRRLPDFGQPETEADLRGLVTSLLGNEVTMLKLDRLGRGTTTEAGQEQAETGEQARALGGAGVPMSGPGGGMRGGMRPDTAASQAEMIERLKEMSTGEEKIIIPVGIKMLKADTTSDQKEGPKMVEASLSDIKSNSMLTVWLDKSVTDKKVAAFVMIMR
jgi:hypothetical protein